MRMQKKQNLPSKLCVCCGLPFTWRKKWERDWASVKFCSDRCRQQGAGNGGAAEAGSVAKLFKSGEGSLTGHSTH